MKTIGIGKERGENRIADFRLFSIIIILMLSIINTTAQEKKNSPANFGVGYSSFLSGNGHGTFYSFFINIEKNKSNFSLGPCIQKISQQTRTVKFIYSYKVADNDFRLRLRFFSYLQYSDRLPISYSAIILEQGQEQTEERWGNCKNPQIDWCKVKLSTLETGAGMELGVKVFKGIEFRNFVGLSVFYHTKYIEGMYNNKCGPIITFGTSINIYNNAN